MLEHTSQWKSSLEASVIPAWATDIIWWLFPLIQIWLLGLLLYKPMVKAGMIGTTILYGLLSVYLLLGLAKVFGDTPCACGSIWSRDRHLISLGMNSSYMALGILYWVLAHRSRPARNLPLDVRRKEDTALS